MRLRFQRLLLLLLVPLGSLLHSQTLTIAAAADLKFALDEIVNNFKKANPAAEVNMVYGSSGLFDAQIQQGAPYDLYFSADIAYPRELAMRGLAASRVVPYAFGRIVLWSTRLDASRMTLASLTGPEVTRIAIANPKHAPYGRRAKEALQSSGLWNQIEPKVVYGDNVAQTAQYVQTGNAQVGIIALSLAVSPALASKGGYGLIPEKLHAPLEQGFIITKRAADNVLAKQFADYMGSRPARAVMTRYGFVLPGEFVGKAVK
jgi:molybdate transport system substrate-binding protein